MKKYGLLAFLLLMWRCSDAPSVAHSAAWEPVDLHRAQNFSLDTLADALQIRVRTPWAGRDSVIVYQRGGTPTPPAIALPDTIRRIACLSSTHVAFLEALGAADRIVGLGAPVFSEAVRDVPPFQAPDGALNYEALLALAPDIVLMYGLDDLAAFRRMQALGLCPVLIEEFREDSPLARAEWLRMIGALIGVSARADRLFEETQTRYTSLQERALAASSVSAPTVLTGMPFRGTWYVPAGQSFVAQLIHDAGGQYLWAHADGELSLALSLEAVLSRAHDAAVWIDQGVVFSKAEMLALEPRFEAFEAFRAGALFNYSARVAPNGSFDMYESAVVHPDWVLADLVHILQPALLPDHDLYYYQRLE